MKTKIVLSIIGAGKIAKEHLKVLKKQKNIHVSSIYSRTQNKAIELAQEFKIKKVYLDLDEMILNEKPDGIMIFVSADQVFTVTKRIMQYKINFFLEKPPGLKPKETKKLILYNKSNIKNMVGFNRRYYSIFKKGIDIINKHGRLLSVSINGHERVWQLNKKFKKDYLDNLLYINSIHTIDLLRFFGGEIKEIKIFDNSFNSHNLNSVASIQFENKIIGTYSTNWDSPSSWSIKLYGQGVTVVFDPLESGYWIDKKFHKHLIKPSKQDKLYKPGFYNQIKAFQNMILKNKMIWPIQDLKNSYKTMCLANKFYPKSYIKKKSN